MKPTTTLNTHSKQYNIYLHIKKNPAILILLLCDTQTTPIDLTTVLSLNMIKSSLHILVGFVFFTLHVFTGLVPCCDAHYDVYLKRWCVRIYSHLLYIRFMNFTCYLYFYLHILQSNTISMVCFSCRLTLIRGCH